MIPFDEAKALRYPLFQDDFGEPGDRVLSDQITTAAKTHQCVECLSPINKGERHRVHAGIYDGGFRRYRYCEGCCEAMSRVFDNDGDPMAARSAIRARNAA